MAWLLKRDRSRRSVMQFAAAAAVLACGPLLVGLAQSDPKSRGQKMDREPNARRTARSARDVDELNDPTPFERLNTGRRPRSSASGCQHR